MFQRKGASRLGQEKNSLQIMTLFIPTLTVRCRHCTIVYEIQILDEEELYLPSPDAIRLGGSNVM